MEDYHFLVLTLWRLKRVISIDAPDLKPILQLQGYNLSIEIFFIENEFQKSHNGNKPLHRHFLCVAIDKTLDWT